MAGYGVGVGVGVGVGGLLLGRAPLHHQYKPVEWAPQPHLDPAAACAPYSYPPVPGLLFGEIVALPPTVTKVGSLGWWCLVCLHLGVLRNSTGDKVLALGVRWWCEGSEGKVWQGFGDKGRRRPHRTVTAPLYLRFMATAFHPKVLEAIRLSPPEGGRSRVAGGAGGAGPSNG
ncbi:hypothetical protein ACJJTC_017640 [Scirpophaga incertulas]